MKQKCIHLHKKQLHAVHMEESVLCIIISVFSIRKNYNSIVL